MREQVLRNYNGFVFTNLFFLVIMLVKKMGCCHLKQTNEKKKKENKLGLIVFVFSIIVCIISLSYAIWMQTRVGKKENKLTTASLVLTFKNEKDAISLIDTVPMSDTKGISLTPYKFTVENIGSVAANYRVYVTDDNISYRKDGCSNKKLDWSNIKYYFESDGKTPEMKILSDNDGVLYTGYIDKGESKNFTLRIWIKSSATNEIMGNHFHGRVTLDAIQSDKNLPN